MKRYKIIVAYDGTDFHGWQIQPSDITVASVLQKTFKRSFKRELSLIGASRTDAGVHALGQTALIVSDLSVPVERIAHAWNNSLPSSVLVRSVQEVDPDFHIFANVESKTYYYHLFTARPLPHIARYGWFWKFIDQVDFEKFGRALKCFVGEHDFSSFCKTESHEKTVRMIRSIKLEKFGRYGVVRVSVTAKGFLRYQIRRMVGAALDIARKKEFSVGFITKQLKFPSDQQEFTRAEGCGLCLRKIVYKN